MMVERHERVKRWTDPFINYIPHFLMFVVVVLSSWIVRLEVARHETLRRLNDIERTASIRWTKINENEDEINLIQLGSQNHSREANEAIDNIKTRLCEVKDRVMRLEDKVMECDE